MLLKLQVRDIEPGEYRLSVRGSGGIQFQKSTPLQYVRKSYSVFIQTDKAVYKPGHKILFRAVVLNSQLKPAAEVRIEPITVHISVSTYYSIRSISFNQVLNLNSLFRMVAGIR